MKPEVAQFLDKHNILSDKVDIQAIVDHFLHQMKEGLAGRKSSLAMIPSFCSPDVKIKSGESVLVIDAGGTNLRTCIVTFDENLKPVLSDFRKGRMPGIDRQVSSQEFFSILADECERLIDKTDRIGFCFSYAADILPDHDGVPLIFSKEIKAPEVIGKHLGKELLSELGRRGHDVSKKKIIIMNDTVTTLLAAQSENADGAYDGCIGFILGTGTNTAYIENNRNITKLEESLRNDANQVVNVESGCLDLVLGDIDKAFLKSTKDPEKYNFEKMISGAYLGPLAHKVIEFAISEGLLSKAFALEFSKQDSLTTIELNNFLLEDESSYLTKLASSEDDYETLTEILGAFVERSAKLTAANLASAVLITDFGKNEDHPVLINADGSTFHKTAFLKSATIEFLDAFLSQKGRRAVVKNIEDSPTIGSAIGALSL